MFEQIFAFSLMVFSHAAISLWLLLFFRFFGLDFFPNGFPIPFIVVPGLVFCPVNEISLNYTPGLVLLCFFASPSDTLFSFYICSHLKAVKSNFLNYFVLSLTALHA